VIRSWAGSEQRAWGGRPNPQGCHSSSMVSPKPGAWNRDHVPSTGPCSVDVVGPKSLFCLILSTWPTWNSHKDISVAHSIGAWRNYSDSASCILVLHIFLLEYSWHHTASLHLDGFSLQR